MAKERVMVGKPVFKIADPAHPVTYTLLNSAAPAPPSGMSAWKDLALPLKAKESPLEPDMNAEPPEMTLADRIRALRMGNDPSDFR